MYIQSHCTEVLSMRSSSSYMLEKIVGELTENFDEYSNILNTMLQTIDLLSNLFDSSDTCAPYRKNGKQQETEKS